eukprot:TRINITY_DN26776_c0_g1_i1.p1 TRINITY_DN26776_c0_g1~~TRINITY_DN26776_c0_g1_i1.p1  ORF type:complete len:3217 (+),score=643.74 TRINITY_DN26776_c0_g1_i1:707-9652(+)
MLEGPAGTGKTETVRDLARAMAVVCFMFVCSSTFDLKASSRFLRGTAASGTWCCFDQLHTVDPQVLCVMAQQVAAIRQALVKGSPIVELEGRALPMRGGLIAMTMPRHCWKAVPGNLKALVRATAMVAPNIERVAEVRLLCLGFSNAEALAHKLTQALKLGSELLQIQEQCDFGLPTACQVLASLASARSRMKTFTLEEEEQQLHSALWRVQVGGLPNQAFEAWGQVLKIVFPHCPAAQATVSSPLKLAVCQELSAMGVTASSYSEVKAAEMYEALQARPGILVLGETLSGKTTTIKALSAALNVHAQAGQAGGGTRADLPLVQLISLTPGSLSPQQLFSSPKGSTSEWKHGVFAKLLAETNSWPQLPTPTLRSLRSLTPDESSASQSPVPEKSPSLSSRLQSRSVSGKPSVRHTSKTRESEHAYARISQGTQQNNISSLINSMSVGRTVTYEEMAALERQANPDFKGHEETLQRSLLPRRWLHLDGDIESCWAEPLHPLLEEGGHGLTLTSAEVFVPAQNFGLIFECADVACASPATISRCTPVYFCDQMHGQASHLEAWVQSSLKPVLDGGHRDQVVQRSVMLLPPLLKFMRSGAVSLLVPNVNEQILAQNFIRLLTGSLYFLADEDSLKALRNMDLGALLDASVVLALTWSLGALAASYRDRRAFHRELCRAVEESGLSLRCSGIPDGGSDSDVTVFDYGWDKEASDWLPWVDILEIDISHNMPITHAVMPTTNMGSATLIISELFKSEMPILVCGASGSGKSTYIKEVIRTFAPTKLQKVRICVHAATSADEVQKNLEEVLEKRGRDTWGPSTSHSCVFFIDDLSLPAATQYSAKQAGGESRPQVLELLRQLCNYGGWYDRYGQEPYLKFLQNCFVAGTMTSLSFDERISRRLLRHFFVLGTLPETVESMSTLFSTILEWRLDDEGMQEDIVDFASGFATTAVSMCMTIQRLLPPTPAYPQLAVGILDIAVVLESLVSQTLDFEDTDLPKMIRVFVHESMRTFCDRCFSREDRSKAFKGIKEAIEDNTLMVAGGALSALQKGDELVFTSITTMPGHEDEDFNEEYQEISDRNQLTAAFELALSWVRKDSLELASMILFPAAIHQVVRIGRALQKPAACAIVAGCPQSGRRSLARFAMKMVNLQEVLLQEENGKGVPQAIDCDTWREKARQVLKSIGGKKRDTHPCICGADDVLEDEAIYADLHQLLCVGYLTDLWDGTQKGEIIDQVKEWEGDALDFIFDEDESEDEEDGDEQKTEVRIPWLQARHAYAERCHSRLRMVLCLSPTSDLFRKRMRQFPAFLKHSTITWFGEWPQEALTYVASRCLEQVNTDRAIVPAASRMCTYMQSSVIEMATPAWKQGTAWRWSYHASLVSVMELVGVFSRIFAAMKAQLEKFHNRCKEGLDGLQHMEEQIERFRESGLYLQPSLEERQASLAEAQRAAETHEKDMVNNLKKELRALEEPIAENGALESRLTDEVREDSYRATEAMAAAETGIERISPNDLYEVKSSRNPANTTKKVLEMVLVLKRQGQVPKKDGTGSVSNDPWVQSQKVIAEAGFIPWALNFDKEHVAASVTTTIAKMLDDDDFEAAKLERSPKAIVALYRWVHAVVEYDVMRKAVRPKQKQLKETQDEIASLLIKAEAKRKEIEDAERRVAKGLEEKQNAVNEFQKRLLDYESHLERCTSLAASLGDEKFVWQKRVAELLESQQNAAGDALLVAGTVVHLGPFLWSDRSDIISSWALHLDHLSLPFKKKSSLIDLLEESRALDRRALVTAGLANDHASLEAAAIARTSRKWPLLIDPEGQAAKWVRKMEQHAGLCVVPGGSLEKTASMVKAACAAKQPLLIEGLQEDSFASAIKVLFAEGLPDKERSTEAAGDSLRKQNQALKRGTKAVAGLAENSTQVMGVKNSILVATNKQGQETKDMLLSTSPPKEQQSSSRSSSKEQSMEQRYAARATWCVAYLATREDNMSLPFGSHCWLTVVDFTPTKETIEAHMLKKLMTALEPAAAQQKVLIEEAISRAQWEVRREEDKIIGILADSNGEILESNTRLSALEVSQASRQSILDGKTKALAELVQIEELADLMIPMSSHASSVFKTLGKLAALSPMYRYSVSYGLQVFQNCIADACARAEWAQSSMQARLAQIFQRFVKDLHEQTTSSLLWNHRPVFSVLLALDLICSRPGAEPGLEQLAKFLLQQSAGSSMRLQLPSSFAELSSEACSALDNLSDLPGFAGLSESLRSKLPEWNEALVEERLEEARLPEPFDKLSHLQRLLVLKCMRPELCPGQFQRWAHSVLGSDGSASWRGEEPHLAAALEASCPESPIVLVLMSSQADPIFGLPQLAEERRAELRTLSLGSGEGYNVETAVSDCRTWGRWILLQNCQLEPRWLPRLACLCDQLLSSPGHPDFRLWLSSQACAAFPSSVLLSCVKVSSNGMNQPPSGLKATLRSILHRQPFCNADFWEACAERSEDWKQMLHSLIYTHVVLLRQQEQGALSWVLEDLDLPESDLILTMQRLKRFMEGFPAEAPQKFMRSTLLEVSYGARVTEAAGDQLLQMLFGTCLQDDLKASPAQGSVVWQLCGVSETFAVPSEISQQAFLEAVARMPDSEPSSLLGLSADARGRYAWKWSSAFFHGLFAGASSTEQTCISEKLEHFRRIISGSSSCESSAGGDRSKDEQVFPQHTMQPIAELVSRILERLPQYLPSGGTSQVSDGSMPSSKADSARRQLHSDTWLAGASVSFALLQEVERYNTLLETIRDSLESLADVCRGEVSLSLAVEDLAEVLWRGEVPAAWRRISYLSCKPVHSYLEDLGNRFDFIRSLLREERPPTLLWLPGFFVPRVLCQAMSQDFARLQDLPGESVTLRAQVLHDVPKALPESGVYVEGLFLLRCRWDERHSTLAEPHVGAVSAACPLLWLSPKEVSFAADGCYECPIHIVAELPSMASERLINFVFSVSLPAGDEGSGHWLRRGARGVLQLDT